jgi:molybdate transport system substrate-binding protein
MMSVLAVLGLAFGVASSAYAAEITVVSSVGVKAVVEELLPQFERATQHKVTMVWGTAVPLKRRLEGGEAFDVAILTPPLIEDLIRQGKIASGTSVNVAKGGIGVAGETGAPKPDISTPEAFRRALLNAKSIIHWKEGQSSAPLPGIFQKLGILQEVQAKTTLETRSGYSPVVVAEGGAELAFAMISEILPVPGVQLVGPLPPELQVYVIFSGGASSVARDAEAAQAFLRFFGTPAAAPVLRAKGMEPG